MGDKWYKPEEISAMILQKLKADAESRLEKKLLRQLLLFRHISTMLSAKRQKMQAKLQALM
jgi:hypothetical protein